MPTANSVRCCMVCGECRPQKFSIYFDGYVKLYKCRSCSFVAQFSGPGNNTLVETYDEYYDLDFLKKGQEFMYPQRSRTFTDIANRIKRLVGSDKKLLDVGCGDAHFLKICETKGFVCTGVEPSKALSAYSATKVKGSIINAEYLPELFPKETFDVITFIQVVEHLLNPQEILKVAKHHLRPGGLLVIEVPSIWSPHFLAYWLTSIKTFVRPPTGVINCHVGYYSPHTLRLLVNTIGFKEQALITGRWQVKYSGLLRLVAIVLDPILNFLRIGGILYFAKKE